jgi:xanthine dehydrogenase iron-sulfur cluster and FAD-binding subunit A
MSSADSPPRPALSAEELRERMSGNICRCGAYSNIAEAITEVAGGPHEALQLCACRNAGRGRRGRRPASRAPASSPAAPTCST